MLSFFSSVDGSLREGPPSSLAETSRVWDDDDTERLTTFGVVTFYIYSYHSQLVQCSSQQWLSSYSCFVWPVPSPIMWRSSGWRRRMSSSSSSSPSLLHLALCCVTTLFALHFSAAAKPPKVGFGYRLVSIEESTNGGGLIGYLQVKQSTSTYGPDIPHLRLFVK